MLLYARTAVAGYYKHKAEQGKDGALEGYSFFIGSSSGYEHNQHKDGISQSTDKVAIVNVLGPSMDLAIYHQGFLIRAKLDMSGDFALVTPYAYDKYEAEHSTAGVQSVLATKRYDYAFGMTVRPSLTVSKGGFEVGVSAHYSLMHSIGGADRKQEEVTHELSFVDTKAQVGGAISYKFGPAALSAELWRRMRTGTIEDTRASGSENVFLGNLSLRF